jgi:hypothetical protein
VAIARAVAAQADDVLMLLALFGARNPVSRHGDSPIAW